MFHVEQGPRPDVQPATNACEFRRPRDTRLAQTRSWESLLLQFEVPRRAFERRCDGCRTLRWWRDQAALQFRHHSLGFGVPVIPDCPNWGPGISPAGIRGTGRAFERRCGRCRNHRWWRDQSALHSAITLWASVCQCGHKAPAFLPVLPNSVTSLGGDAVGTLQ